MDTDGKFSLTEIKMNAESNKKTEKEARSHSRSRQYAIEQKNNMLKTLKPDEDDFYLRELNDDQFNRALGTSYPIPFLYNERVTQLFGSVFDSPNGFSLGHFVSEDLHLCSGIARKFRAMYGSTTKLQYQKQCVGGLAILNYSKFSIYYLVVKERFYDVPTYYALWKSFKTLKNHCQRHNIKRLALQHDIALNRYTVKFLLEFVFEDYQNITIFLYTDVE